MFRYHLSTQEQPEFAVGTVIIGSCKTVSLTTDRGFAPGVYRFDSPKSYT